MQGTLGTIIGRLDPVLNQEEPKRRHLPLQSSDQSTGLILTVMIPVDQSTKASIPRFPLSAGRRGFGHPA